MKTSGVRIREERRLRMMSGFPMETGLFCMLFYVYVWLVVDPRLIHHSLGVFTPYFDFAFASDWEFFLERVARPGGLVAYATALLSQCYRFGWAGALVTTVVAWGMCLCTDALRGRTDHPSLARYVPAIVLLMLLGNYAQPLAVMLSLLVSLLSLVLYRLLAPDSSVKRVGLMWLLCLIAYHVAGPRSVLFPVLAAVDELRIGRQAVLAAIALLGGVGLPLLVEIAIADFPDYGASRAALLMDTGIPPQQWPYSLVLFALFPTVLFYSAFEHDVAQAETSFIDRQISSEPRAGGFFRFLRAGQSRWFRTTIALAVSGAAAWLSLDRNDRAVLEMDYYAQQERWDQVLEAAERMPRGRYNLGSNRNILMALQHTGRLGDEMFRYPQMGGKDVFASPEEDRDGGTWFQESRLFLDLGLVNQAERSAYEALSVRGPVPGVLLHLAKINWIKRQPKTARIFLDALARNPFDRRSAASMRRRLDSDPQGDLQMQRCRSFIPERDNAAILFPVEERLLALLEKNKGNKAAFEFLMAYYLARGKADQVAASMGRLADFNYRTLPRHYQEAVVSLGRTPESLQGTAYQIRPEVARKAERLTEIVRDSPNAELAVRRAMAAGLGDTYFFYLTFGFSGL